MCPVNDISGAVVLYDNVGWVEIAVAYLLMLVHTLEAGVQLITCGGVEVGFADLAVHFVLQLVEHRALCSMNLHLKVNEHFKVLVLLCGVLLHELCKGLALNELRNDCPLAVDHLDFKHFGYVNAYILYTRLIERFVEYVRLCVALVKYLDQCVAFAVDGLAGSDS